MLFYNYYTECKLNRIHMLTRRDVIFAGLWAAVATKLLTPSAETPLESTVTSAPVILTELSEKEKIILEKEKALWKLEREFFEWINSPEGQDAYTKWDYQTIFEKLRVISWLELVGTKYDPMTHFEKRPSETLDTTTWEVGRGLKCNVFQILDGRNVSAAHCLESFIGNLGITSDVWVFSPIIDWLDMEKIKFDRELRDADIHWRIVVWVGYDDEDEFTTYRDGTKVFWWIALKLNQAMIRSIIEAWSREWEDVRHWEQELEWKIMYVSTADFVNSADWLSWSPIFLWDKLCGIYSWVMQIPNQNPQNRDWIISYFPWPDLLNEHL